MKGTAAHRGHPEVRRLAGADGRHHRVTDGGERLVDLRGRPLHLYLPALPTVTGVTTVASPPGGPTGGGTVVNVTGHQLLRGDRGRLRYRPPAPASSRTRMRLALGDLPGGHRHGRHHGDQLGRHLGDLLGRPVHLQLDARHGERHRRRTGPARRPRSGTTSQPPNDVFNVLSLMTGGPAVDPTHPHRRLPAGLGDHHLQLQLLGVHPGPDRRRLLGGLDLRRHDDRHPDRDASPSVRPGPPIRRRTA